MELSQIYNGAVDTTDQEREFRTFNNSTASGAALATFLMLGKSISAGTFAIIDVFAAEVFPTVARNVGVGASSMSARVGGLLQPQLARLVRC